MNLKFVKMAKQVKLAERFQHARAFKCRLHHQNALKSCNYSSNESLSKLRFDIKFEIFDMKVRNHLFSLLYNVVV